MINDQLETSDNVSILSQDVSHVNKKETPLMGLCSPVPKVVSCDDVIAFGGIKSDDSKGVRSSGRLQTQPNADATQLERAMSVAQKKNDSFGQGMTHPQPLSILSFSDSQIIHNASLLGVSLGSSSVDRIASAQLIKDTELQRTLTILKNNEGVSENGGGVGPCLVASHASDLSEDLVDSDHIMDEELMDNPPQVCKPKRFKKKRSYDKSKVRRSNRLRIKQNRS